MSNPSSKPGSISLSQDTISWLLILVALAGAGYSLYLGWLNIIPQEETVIAEQKEAVADDSQISVKIPEIVLNNGHQRHGAEVKVDASLIGKENPFR